MMQIEVCEVYSTKYTEHFISSLLSLHLLQHYNISGVTKPSFLMRFRNCAFLA